MEMGTSSVESTIWKIFYLFTYTTGAFYFFTWYTLVEQGLGTHLPGTGPILVRTGPTISRTGPFPEDRSGAHLVADIQSNPKW